MIWRVPWYGGIFFLAHTEIGMGWTQSMRKFFGAYPVQDIQWTHWTEQILTKRKTLMKLSKTHENAEMDT